MSWSIRCVEDLRRGTAFASTCNMYPRSSGPAGGKHLLQLVCRSDVELIVAAVLGFLVRPPALKDRRVSKPVAFHMIVLHLAYALDPQRLPRQILAGAPAALAAGHPARLRLRVGPVEIGRASCRESGWIAVSVG